jgi:ubiquitin carboxyl-terminal hydrolase 34
MCCNIVLKHFATKDTALFNLLIRCPHAKVRSQTRSFFIDCLKVSREKEPTLYGLECNENDMESESSALRDGVLVDVILRLRQMADDTYQSIRGWDDFYLTLTQIVEMGHAETTVFLNHGFLDFCLRMLSMHVHRRLQDDYPELWRILSKKVGIYNRLVEFFSTLLSRMDTSLPLIPSGLIDNRGATLDRECLKFPLTHRERQMLFYWDPELKAIAVLDKALEMFDQSKVEYFYPGYIIKSMLGWADPHAQSNLFKTINDGLGLDPPFCDAYVRAALSFCEASPAIENVTRVITTVSKAIASVNRLEEERLPSGMAVLDFFIGLLKAENEALFEQRHPYVFFYWVMARSRIWAPAMLLNPIESVRHNTQVLVSELYKGHEEWPSDMVLFKWRSLRELLGDMMQRIIYEKDAGMLRMHLTSLISTAQFFVHQIVDLVQNEDPAMDMYRDDTNDSARIYSWQTDIEPRLHSWPQDDSLSAGDLYDQSDFGSESDVEEVADVE